MKKSNLLIEAVTKDWFGKLIQLSHTHLDIAYVVSVVRKLMHTPLKQHLDVVYRILRYLKKASKKGILFKKVSKLKLKAYTDSD